MKNAFDRFINRLQNWGKLFVVNLPEIEDIEIEIKTRREKKNNKRLFF